MTWLVLTFIGCWCLASALTATAYVVKRRYSAGLAAGSDLFFSFASIGLLFLLLAERVG